jgi:CheY-like chemotaxis protein/HPt (histidine-containing phosphotransfer) domain-containing protein
VVGIDEVGIGDHSASSSPSRACSVNQPLILIADDNPLSLRFLVEALAAGGYDCVAAEDGNAALRHGRTSAFDLLLLDARMPGMDGGEVLAHLRSQAGPSRDAIALATTAASDAAAIATLRAAGFVDVLPKPIGTDALRNAVARHLHESVPAGDLDDEQARRAAGGDEGIVASLRGLFSVELEALPAQIATFAAGNDMAALRERLHRLEASAGFCGAPALARAISAVRASLDGTQWPAASVTTLLEVSERTRQRLSG